MKSLKKFSAFFVALAMIISMVLSSAGAAVYAVPGAKPATPATTTPATTTETVTLHKILMSPDNIGKFPSTKGLNEKDYTGGQIESIDGYFGNGAKEIAGVYFVLKYNGEYVKKGNDDLTPESINDAGVPTTTKNIDEAVGGSTTDSGLKFITRDLKGKFEIDEIKDKSKYSNNGSVLTGSAAVPVEITLPLVNKDGIVKDAHVYPKNTESQKPKIDKNFLNEEDGKKDPKLKEFYDSLTDEEKNDLGADLNNPKKKNTVDAEIGRLIPYEVKTAIEKGAAYKNLTWGDTMTKGLTYNKDVVLTESNSKVTFEANTDYVITDDARGFNLELTEAGLKKLEAAAKNGALELKLVYTATVNSDAVVDVADTNDIKLEYGNKPNKKHEPKSPNVNPADKKIKVTKSWADGDPRQDADVKVVYTLYKADDNTEVASVTKDFASGYNHEFTGLEDGIQYYVKERVIGYNPAYAAGANGQLTVTNTKNDNPPPLNPGEPKVVTYGRKFVKTDSKSNRLTGAEFYVKKDEKYLAVKSGAQKVDEVEAVKTAKEALDAAVKAYNERTDNNNEEALKKNVTDKQAAYNDAVKASATDYEWIDGADGAYVLVSNKDGQFEITGLEAGDYALEEKTAPKGFAKLTTDLKFSVGQGSYTADAEGQIPYKTDGITKDAIKVENKTVDIPQTGGIGTIIFAVAGIALMGFAAYAMRKNSQREE